MKNRALLASLVFTLAFAWMYGCNDSSNFSYNLEGIEPAAEAPPGLEDPFNPPTTGGNTTTDTFTQGSGAVSDVDIVWVIDDSGSMSNDQQAISTNASRFTDKLVTVTGGWQLIVVTTNVSQNSRLENQCDSIITSANASEFEDCAIVGTNSTNSGREEGLEAARRALDSEYPRGPWNGGASSTPLNSGFLRSGADLHVVIVSDEEEEPDDKPPSSNTWSGKAGVTSQMILDLRAEMIADLSDAGHEFDTRYKYFPTVANHLSFFQGLKSGPQVRIHGIVTTRLDGSDSCHTRQSSEEIGQRYIALANATGGSVTDICGDWSETMDRLGLEASGLRSCFSLTHVPTQVSSIQVEVNNVATTNFTYNPFSHQVCFPSSAIPPANASVEITYL